MQIGYADNFWGKSPEAMFDVPLPQPEITEDDLRAFFPTSFQVA